jgi:hypothetical protein
MFGDNTTSGSWVQNEVDRDETKTTTPQIHAVSSSGRRGGTAALFVGLSGDVFLRSNGKNRGKCLSGHEKVGETVGKMV